NATEIIVTAGVSTDQIICEGESVTLTASGGSSYKWSTGATTQNITVSPNQTTTYSVIVSEGDVSETAEVTVTVTALPIANAGVDKTIEEGESVTLSASGGSSYKWNTGATTQSITVSPNQTTIYTVEVFNAGNCSTIDDVKVIVNATEIIVTAGVSTDQIICEGESVTLTASGGSSYKWSTGATTQNITVSPNQTTTYSVIVSEGDVSETAEVTVTVTALPIANAGVDKTIEEGESVTLSASGGSSYKWNTGATTQNITVSPNQTTIYTVEVFNAGDCSTIDDVKVIVNATEIIVTAYAGEDQIICEGESVTLAASGGSSYKWSTGATTQNITVSPNQTTIYNVVVSEGDVSETAEVTVTVTALPIANAGVDKTIEEGEFVTLTATGGSDYIWSTGETTSSITVSPNQTTNYTVEVFNAGDCSTIDDVKVIVNATEIIVTAYAGEDQIICEGESVTLAASGGSSYKWSTGATTQNITVSPNQTTTYNVVVSEGDVSNTAEVTIHVDALPVANAGVDKTIEEGEFVTLTATGGSDYIWSTGETTSSITVSPNQTTNYTVEVFNVAGCYTEDSVTVNIEYFKVEELEEVIPDFEFGIYPNPTSGILNIKISGLMVASPIRLSDMSGKVLYNEIIQSDGSLKRKTLDLSSYPKGFYMLSIYKYGKPITRKVVIK
ncbi:T9SS type A sorting domain-containing protein, partial [uncultured Formosa sp.]|uniref:T9SS type A sorting domain-containing protein n=1 Tax=uncultured Formosa sp. TaxID=255435 RepID=UPI0026207E0E